VLDYAAKVSLFGKIQSEFSRHMSAGNEDLPASLWRKIFWYLALKEVNKTDLFQKLDNICLFPSKRVDNALSVFEVIPRALDAEDEGCLYSEEERMCCFRSDYIPDSFIGHFRGKYWSVSTWESNAMYSQDFDLEENIFEEFFSRYPDRIVTEENFPEFLEQMNALIGIFLPEVCIEPVLEFLKLHDELFLERNMANGQPVFLEEVVDDVIEKVITFLRFDVKAKDIVISGFRKIYEVPDCVSDEALYSIYKALYQQPLMVNFNDHLYAGPVDYTILMSISLGFLYKQKDTYRQCYSAELCRELNSFYETIEEMDVIFPYHKFGGCDIDVCCLEHIYVAGCYPVMNDYCGVEENADLSIPSLPDIVILQKADELYEKCLCEQAKTKRGELYG